MAAVGCVLLLSGCGSRLSAAASPTEPLAAVTSGPTATPTTAPLPIASAVPAPPAPPAPTAVPSPAPLPAATTVTPPSPPPAPIASPAPAPLTMPWGEWVLDLSSIDRSDEGVEVTLGIGEERGRLIARGSSGCNGYGSTVALDGGVWRFTGDGVSSSGMGCPPESMAVEDAYMDRFVRVTRWSMADDVLLLEHGGTTPLRFTRAG